MMKVMILTLLTCSMFLSGCGQPAQTLTTTPSGFMRNAVRGDSVSSIGNNIMVIYQDQQHNYWMGSWQDGLYKYDGKCILHYTIKQGLPSNRIEEIKEDKQGNIYINTSKGIIKFDGRTFLELQVAWDVGSNWALSADDLWFKNFTEALSVYRWDGNVLHKLSLPKHKLGEDWMREHPGNTSPYAVYCTYKDSKGYIWFGTAALGVLRYNGSQFDWITESDVNELHHGPSNGVRSITEDKEGYFWFNTEYKYKINQNTQASSPMNGQGLFYERVKSIGSLDGKKDSDLNEYLYILKDDNTHLWIAIYLNGVWKLEGERVIHYPIQVNGKNIPIFCLFKDHNGDIWLGSQENGVFKFNGKSFEKFNLSDGQGK